jgi:cytochrome c-type biogenesis protein CcmH
MTGWVILALLFALAMLALWLLRVRGPILLLAASAMLFGSIGYIVMGHPALHGSPREAASEQAPIPLTDMRHAFFGNFTGEESWLTMSEALARAGDTEQAVGVLQNAVQKYPGNAQLWVGLGNALVDHSGVLTPASQYAYQHAAELAPGHPAPLFFMGLALARSGDSQDALVLWRQILANAPADAEWRPMVKDAVAALQPSLSGHPALQPH